MGTIAIDCPPPPVTWNRNIDPNQLRHRFLALALKSERRDLWETSFRSARNRRNEAILKCALFRCAVSAAATANEFITNLLRDALNVQAVGHKLPIAPCARGVQSLKNHSQENSLRSTRLLPNSCKLCRFDSRANNKCVPHTFFADLCRSLVERDISRSADNFLLFEVRRRKNAIFHQCGYRPQATASTCECKPSERNEITILITHANGND